MSNENGTTEQRLEFSKTMTTADLDRARDAIINELKDVISQAEREIAHLKDGSMPSLVGAGQLWPEVSATRASERARDMKAASDKLALLKWLQAVKA